MAIKRLFQILLLTILIITLFLSSNGIINLNNLTQPKIALAQSDSRFIKLNNYNNFTPPRPNDSDYDQKIQNLFKRDYVKLGEPYAHLANITPEQVRNSNPSAKVYVYYTLSSKPSSDTDWNKVPGDPGVNDNSYRQQPVSYYDIDQNNWWLRDGDGNIVKESAGSWFIDVGIKEFQDKFAQDTISRLNGTGYDGIIFDYWWPAMVSRWMTTQGLPASAKYPDDTAWFNNAWVPFVENVIPKVKAAGYQIIGNEAGNYYATSVKQQYDRTMVDGTIYEQGVVDYGHNDANGNPTGSEWLTGTIVERRINSVADDNKITWVSDNGIRDNIPDADQKRLVSLAYYYVAIPADQHDRSYGPRWDGLAYWYDMWDFDIGTPIADQEKITNKYAWSRKYSNGLVLLNYGIDANDTEEVNFTLDKEYVDKAGTVYSGNVTLPAHTALILQTKAPIIPANKVIVTKSASTNMAMAGDTITFTISVNNQSATTANNVILTDPIDPTQLQFIDADRNGSLVNNQVTWPSLDIPINQTETFTFRARVL